MAAGLHGLLRAQDRLHSQPAAGGGEAREGLGDDDMLT
eukprot:CAMPEP_0179290426 /NCGR_PEP_ID=MMETSP0797-20121207/41809_1 /TAXON_ID=47934 /ORGANISM="Dinophysis acuminata, Strain DAEP01" /LENGTH=37 /DNA_ID= /DNA_START= /DNA_END= /DNA_ORIENTATION=